MNRVQFLRKKNKQSLFLILLASISCFPFGLNADVVILRSGLHYSDVRVQPFAESHRILFSSGRVLIIPNSEIRSVRPGPTTWNQPAQAIGSAKSRSVEPIHSITPSVEQGDSTEKVRLSEYRWKPIIKSAVFPGWGQYAEGREGAGSLYTISTVLALQQYWTLRQKHEEAERDYNDPRPVAAVVVQAWAGSLSILDAAAINIAYLSQKERQVHNLQEQGNNMASVLMLIWGWNMLDIVSGKALWWSRGSGPTSGKPALNFQIQKDSIMITVITHL